MTKHEIVITSSQNWIGPSGVTHVDAKLIGGGASGACGNRDAYASAGKGGQAGTQTNLSKFAVNPGASYLIIIGRGGDRSGGGNNPGGETSAFGESAPGGAGNAGNPTGQNGYGNDISAHDGYPTNYDFSNAGPGGVGYGAGGGGGSGIWSGAPPSYHSGDGGEGAPGAVIITYYVPEPSFSADSTTGVSPKTITFTGAGTETPIAWYWDFGDGSTSTSQNPTHTYAITGKITVSLTVTNAYTTTTLTKSDYLSLLWKPTSHAALIDSDPWRR